MTAKTRPGPKDPLDHVVPKVTVTNALLGISTMDDLTGRAALIARALYRGISGLAADRLKDEPRFIYEPAYFLGRLLADYLPDEDQEPACPEPQKPAARRAGSSRSKTASTPPTRSARSRV